MEIITKYDLVRIDPNNFDCLWIHIDRPGLSQGWTNLSEAFRNEEFITKLRNYVKEGGNLYLTKYATQLTVPVERIPEKYAPNIFDTGSGNTGDTPWYIQAQINYLWKESDPDIFHDRTHHDIYIGMTMQEYQANDESRYNAFPAIQGDVENHNCLWDLNRFYTGGNKVEQFREENLVRILGTWGHVVDDAVAGIIEFRPPQIQGRIIANGLAAYELSPRLGGNSYTANVERLTGNILRYLESKDTRGSMTFVETPETDTTPPAPVFTSSPGAITYRGVTPGETIYVYTPDGRLAANSTAIYPDGSISLPLRGTAIVRCGSHAAKILIK